MFLLPGSALIQHPLYAQPGSHPQPQQHMPAPARPTKPSNAPNGGRTAPIGQHLGDWMETHRNLPLAQQQSAIEAEPGFRQLNPQVQQRLHERITQLNNMTPERRQQVLARTEAMSRLEPAQRQQVRDAYAQLGSLPLDRRRAVARSFNYARTLPPEQRQNYLNSPDVRGQFNDSERGTLNNLLNAPYVPPVQSAPQQQFPPQGPPPYNGPR